MSIARKYSEYLKDFPINIQWRVNLIKDSEGFIRDNTTYFDPMIGSMKNGAYGISFEKKSNMGLAIRQGSWKQDKMNGKGSAYYIPNHGPKQSFTIVWKEGEWCQDLLQGKGTVRVYNTSEKIWKKAYVGNFVDNFKSEFGIYYFENMKYEGQFENDCFNGQSRLTKSQQCFYSSNLKMEDLLEKELKEEVNRLLFMMKATNQRFLQCHLSLKSSQIFIRQQFLKFDSILHIFIYILFSIFLQVYIYLSYFFLNFLEIFLYLTNLLGLPCQFISNLKILEQSSLYILNSMQKWQQKQRQRAHQLRIQNAKPSIKSYSSSKERASNSSRTKKTPTTKQNITPVGRILEIFQLEKYGPLLATYGFPYHLTAKKSLKYLDEIIDQVAEKDKEKFLSLLDTLTIMSKDLQKQVISPQQTTKSRSKNRKIHYPPTPSISTQNKQAPNSVQKSEKTTIKFRIKQRSPITTSIAKKGNLNKIIQIDKNTDNSRRSEHQTRQFSISTDTRMKKCISYMQSRAYDDLSLIHDFSLGTANQFGILRPVQQSNKIIQKLMQKLQVLNPSYQKQQECNMQVNLQLQKIKNMYLSFDSATLTSNITNIDLHQMIECLAMEVRYLITHGEVNNLAKSNVDKIKTLLHESIVLMREQSTKSKVVEDQNLQEKDEIAQLGQQKPEKQKKVYKNSLQHLDSGQLEEDNNPSIKKFQYMRQIDFYEEQNKNLDDQYDTDKSSIEEDLQNCSIDLNSGMKQSSIWGNSYIASVINDFSCFDYTLESSAFLIQPQYEDIRNFIELVVMAGKMEKQVPIIAYIYLNRLLHASTVKQAKVTYRNWKNLILVTLIEASKIWDDQSLENHSFAKLIKPYTTLEINRLQKYLVYFLDYRLTIDQKQYSQAYFQLRRHVGQKKTTQTSNMMRLDLKTIQKLQQSGIYGMGNNKKASKIEKNQFYKKLMNKSF